MRLSELLNDEAAQLNIEGATRDVDILGLASDSRAVRPGDLFAALPGGRADGRDFIADALQSGAHAILAPPGTPLPADAGPVPVINDDNPRRRLALMAARFYGLQPETIAAVTGTNGKTSVVSFAEQIWTRLGHRAAALGTLGLTTSGAGLDGITRAGSLTTPDPVALHRHLADLKHLGVDHLALEASSHGLDQFRLDGVVFQAAAFTNLSRDHLDYHGTYEAYFAAKTRLFDTLLAAGGSAVLNADAPEFAALSEIAKRRDFRILSFGTTGADITVTALEPSPEGQSVTIRMGGASHDITLGLVGGFQAMNAACALALVMACGGDFEPAVGALEHLRGVPGRVEFTGRHRSGATVYVDYAHTPDALAHVLGALRPHVRGRLVVVFGCGGDRDAGKRPEMGAIAARLADWAIVTDDNPRTEDAATIRRQILKAAPEALEIGDRAQAIVEAIAGLKAGDILVVAGKGHEQGQIVGTETLAFDDRDQVRAALEDTGDTG